MITIKEGTLRAWWDGYVGWCLLCQGSWTLTHTDTPEGVDWQVDSNGLTYPAAVFKCPTKGCTATLHFRPR